MTEAEKLKSQAAIDRAAGIAGGWKWLASATDIGKTRLHNCKTGRFELTSDEAVKIAKATGVPFASLRPDFLKELRKAKSGKARRRPSKSRN